MKKENDFDDDWNGDGSTFPFPTHHSTHLSTRASKDISKILQCKKKIGGEKGQVGLECKIDKQVSRMYAN